MFSIILSTVACSIISSFLISRVYLNAQYFRSNSGYRQLHVIAATRSIGKAIHTGDASEEAALCLKYRYSLGVLISRLYRAFDTAAPMGAKEAALLLTDGKNGDVWSFYDKHIRPVKEDITNNAFIGWLPFVHNVKLMTALWDICHHAENIVMYLAATEGGDITGRGQREHGELEENYRQLGQAWSKWLTLNKVEEARG